VVYHGFFLSCCKMVLFVRPTFRMMLTG
jgi:hypothetical protein